MIFVKDQNGHTFLSSAKAIVRVSNTSTVDISKMDITTAAGKPAISSKLFSKANLIDLDVGQETI